PMTSKMPTATACSTFGRLRTRPALSAVASMLATPARQNRRLGEALDSYEADLKTRGADTGNVTRIRCHLPARLRDKAIALLSSGELRKWRDGLAKTLAPATVNRTCTAVKAALNLATDQDEADRQPSCMGNGARQHSRCRAIPERHRRRWDSAVDHR